MLKNVFCLFLLVLFVTCNLFAEAGESGVPSLMMDSYGARAMSLGDAFVGIADDAEGAISVNPAGLGMLNLKEASIMYMQYPMDMMFGFVAFGMPISEKAGSIGASLTYFSLAEFAQFDYVGNEMDQKLSAGDIGVNIAYANNPLKLLGMDKNLNVGVGVKYISATLVDDTQTAIGFDVGALYKMTLLPFGSADQKDNLGIGFAIQNLGTSVKYGNEETVLPQNMRFGIGYNGYKDKKNSVLLGFEVNLPNDSSMLMSVGLEYSFMNMIFARVGYKPAGREVDGISAGLGGKYTLSGIGLSLDYGFIPLADFGTMHSVSLGVAF